MLNLTAESRGRPVILLKQKNIAVDEIGRILCAHLLARAQ